MSDRSHAWIVLYDGDCGFCKVMLAAVLTWDRARRLDSAPIQSDTGERLLAAMPVRERLASWHLTGVNRDVHSGGAALPIVLAALPGGAPLSRIAARLPRVTSSAYEWVASRRALLGRLFGERARTWAEQVIAARQTAS